MKTLIVMTLMTFASSGAIAGMNMSPEKCATKDGRYELAHRKLDSVTFLRNDIPGDAWIYSGPELETVTKVDDEFELYTVRPNAIAKNIQDGIAYFDKEDGSFLLSIETVWGSMREKNGVSTYRLSVKARDPVSGEMIPGPLTFHCHQRELSNP